jgi:hypothetical protein
MSYLAVDSLHTLKFTVLPRPFQPMLAVPHAADTMYSFANVQFRVVKGSPSSFIRYTGLIQPLAFWVQGENGYDRIFLDVLFSCAQFYFISSPS